MDAKKTMLAVAAGLVLLYVVVTPDHGAGAVKWFLDALRDGAEDIQGLIGRVLP